MGLRLGPIRVQLSNEEYRALAAAIEGIDVAQPVLLTTQCWAEDAPFTTDSTRPEDELFRAGWKSFPVLLDLVEHANTDRRRRAWILGLLWDLSGCHVPIENGHSGIGSHRWIRAWTSREPPATPLAVLVADDAPIDPRFQDELIARWRKCRDWVNLESIR